MDARGRRTEPAELDELAVGFGANLQVGQDLYVSYVSYLSAGFGHLYTVRAVAQCACRKGAGSSTTSTCSTPGAALRIAPAPDHALAATSPAGSTSADPGWARTGPPRSS